MSIRIALRLPEDVVAFIDAQVEAGRARSRADVVNRLVERDRRRIQAASDVEILLGERRDGTVGDLDELAASVRSTPLDLD
jgi:Arc/MetJ-type ribon-helix-helix transcriptional regulator